MSEVPGWLAQEVGRLKIENAMLRQQLAEHDCAAVCRCWWKRLTARLRRL